MKPTNLIAISTRLQSDFNTLATTRLGADEATAQKWSRELIARYTEPQRHYHTIEHIYSMLRCRDRYYYHCQKDDDGGKKDKDAAAAAADNDDSTVVLALAIFFHDWIYDPTAKDNERQSIARFREFSRDVHLKQSIVARVSTFIECTIAHALPPPMVRDNSGDEGDDDDGSVLRLFLDFDLEVLSRGEVEYALYAAQIKREYGHLSEVEYCVGRIEVLRKFLGRGRLYFSEEFYRVHERDARANLEGEVEVLEKRLRDLGRDV